ncbi:MAG: outer membrane lipoprotein carrier protein LolA [Pseudomonadota bacterium]
MKPISPFRSYTLALAALAVPASAIALGIVTAIPAQAQQSATPALADLEKVSRHLRGIQTLRADFVQTDRSNQQLSGRLTLKQPGRIRFEYQKDAQLLIVADGRSLTMVDYEVAQVQRWPIKKSPLGALLDPDRDITRYGRLLDTGSPNVVSVEVSDDDRPEYGTITMVFRRDATAPEGIELAGWVALDSQNKRTTVSLSNHRYNQTVADSAFRWRDPRVRRGRR